MPFSLVSVVHSIIEHLQLDGFPVSLSSIQSYPHLHVCEVHDGLLFHYACPCMEACVYMVLCVCVYCVVCVCDHHRGWQWEQ